MQKAFLTVFVVAAALILSGCSGSNKTATTTTTTNTSQGEQSDVDPWLQSKKFVREQITDPALYNYVSSSGLGSVNSSTRSDLTISEQAKIGKVSVFSKSSKYGLSGSAEITSSDSIAVKNFTYNGACGTISLQIAASNAPERPIATVKSISNALSAENGNFSLTIPSNVSLIQFNVINAVCPNAETPVSQATFN